MTKSNCICKCKCKNGRRNSSLFLYMEFARELFQLLVFTIWVFLVKSVRIIFPLAGKSLKGEIVLVTGGANGIGREICHELVRTEPHLTVVIWDMDRLKAKETVKELEAMGVDKAVWFVVDISDGQQVENGAKMIRNQIGDVTMLFNNAGIAGQVGDGWKMSPEILEKVFKVNLLSRFFALKEFLPPMIQRGRGHVIETCSVGGVTWGPHGSPYVASKHAIKAYIECIKEDIRHLPEKPDIAFTLVYPELIKTDMTTHINFSSIKYPFIVSNPTPQCVAKKVIEGVRRNEEHVFIPDIYRFLPLLVATCPAQLFQRLTDFYKMDYKHTV